MSENLLNGFLVEKKVAVKTRKTQQLNFLGGFRRVLQDVVSSRSSLALKKRKKKQTENSRKRSVIVSLGWKTKKANKSMSHGPEEFIDFPPSSSQICCSLQMGFSFCYTNWTLKDEKLKLKILIKMIEKVFFSGLNCSINSN